MAEMKAELAATKDQLKGFQQAEFSEIDPAIMENFKCVERIEELEELDLKLKNDVEFAAAVKKCGYIGGKDFADATRRILSSVFSHERALSLSWSAANGKISIQKYPSILLFIKVALRSNKAYKEVPQTAIEEIIKRWFRYASDRNGGRMERLKKNAH